MISAAGRLCCRHGRCCGIWLALMGLSLGAEWAFGGILMAANEAAVCAKA
jgi:hypothetical protein